MSIPEIFTQFINLELWDKARWSATTFRWHPSSQAPPIMGIVFENADPGQAIFREWRHLLGGIKDTFEQIRVSIIDGSSGSDSNAYSVHLCPDAEGVLARATISGTVVDSDFAFLGRWNRMYPIPGQPNLLQRFKQEYTTHREYLLAPVTRRDDGQLWVDVDLGIIKKTIHFRDLREITEGDVDAAALSLPMLITLPAE